MLMVALTSWMSRLKKRLATLALVLTLCACHEDTKVVPVSTQPDTASQGFYTQHFERRPDAATLTSLGRLLFFDRSLSASGAQACATCHDPARAFSPDNHEPVQSGGVKSDSRGVRAVPSLRYLQAVPPFTEHFYESDGNNSRDQGPAGGYTWDGRARSAHEQAESPLLSPTEMANADRTAVTREVQDAPYAQQFRDAFGEKLFEQPALTFDAIVLALEVFQQSPEDFYPYTSKYDAYLRGQTQLSKGELHGLELFVDARKGNCDNCHHVAIREGAFPQFTDYGFNAIAVPRNPKIPANADPGYFDLGLCGPLRTDLKDRPEYCGLFRTPSLRNVSLKRRYFHNGAFDDLRKVVEFYAERDLHPEQWYPRGADGKLRLYDDLPSQYWKNINRDPPFDRKPGDAPALTSAEIDDVVSFLKTLTDGWEADKK
jgi:cytochrome c peroxidase